MPSFFGKNIRIIQLVLNEEQCFKEIWNSSNSTNSRQDFESLVVQQDGPKCLVSFVKNPTKNKMIQLELKEESAI